VTSLESGRLQALSRTRTLEAAREALRRTFGHPDFRPPQTRVVEAALADRDVLAVLPTGFGKSVCFQVPALIDGGTTLVVSPLISLIEDQVAGARARGIAARAWTSVTPAADRAALDRELGDGSLRLLYVSPERLGSAAARRRLAAVRARRLVVDEAHCITEWGHDFRPAYRRIGLAHRALGAPPVLALTATATVRTRRDIERSLGLREPVRVLLPVDRPNLRFTVRAVRHVGEAFVELVDTLRRLPGAAIVYARTRERSARLAIALSRWGFSAAAYHARLPVERRRWVQSRFLDDELRVVCATSAFGMGIDHAAVRFVGHLGAPPSLEDYVQECGRGGRDGDPAGCVMWRLAGEGWPPARRGDEGGAAAARAVARYEAVSRYVAHRGCRRAFIARYFGERPAACRGCDRCAALGPCPGRGRGSGTPSPRRRPAR